MTEETDFINGPTCGCAREICRLRFTKHYIVSLGKDVTVQELYKFLNLQYLDENGYDEKHLIRLSLAVDRHGRSRGIANLRIPAALEQRMLAKDGSLLKGQKLQIVELKRKHGARLLKKYRWLRPIDTYEPASVSTPVVCNFRPLHYDCYKIVVNDEDPIHNFLTEPYFDVGARLFHKHLEMDLDKMLAKAHSLNITHINMPCYNMEQCEQAVKLVKLYDGLYDLYFSAGVGPPHTVRWCDDWQRRLEQMYQMDRCSSAGLIGLDLRWKVIRHCPRHFQMQAFEAQLQLACKYNKPVLIVEREAHQEMVDVLTSYCGTLPPCAIYLYTDCWENIRNYIALGCFVVVTAQVEDFKFCLSPGISESLLKDQIPLSRILLASNSPGFHGDNVLPHRPKFANKNEDDALAFKTTMDIFYVGDNERRNIPPCVYVAKDLVANALGRQLYDKDLIRDLHDNSLKFFRIGHYKEMAEKGKPIAERPKQDLEKDHFCWVYEQTLGLFTMLVLFVMSVFTSVCLP